ncbi:MAG: Mur ligase family, catalytic domain, partial [Planctomycetota bacterium]
MQVSALVKAVDGVTLVAGGEVEVLSLVDDSRLVTPGALFVARAGAKGDGRQFIQDALAKGAVAVLADEGVAPIDGVAWIAARKG